MKKHTADVAWDSMKFWNFLEFILCPCDYSEEPLRYGPPSICLSVSHIFHYRVCVINSSHNFDSFTSSHNFDSFTSSHNFDSFT